MYLRAGHIPLKTKHYKKIVVSTSVTQTDGKIKRQSLSLQIVTKVFSIPIRF